ncbi:MAG: diguanylate cyclase, partial [Spirochaetales bacterium]|nr:diguanylate cyclase [Spirochaetales bacterium]
HYMKIIRKKTIYLELILASILLLIIDLIFLDNPIFYKHFYILYWVYPVLFSLFFGEKWIIPSFVSSIITIFISLYINSLIYNYKQIDFIFGEYIKRLPVSVGFISIILYFISIIISRYTNKIDALNERLKKVSLDSLHYKRTALALEIINNEFESQLSRSQNSITTLYKQIEKLNKLNSSYIIEILLETIKQFVSIRKATIWEYDEDKDMLKLIASEGFYNSEPGPYLDMNGTVEGYVYRNNQFFTIRKIKDYHSISINESKKNLITMPITINKKVWGVLNIEDMPFEKYSRYSEQLLHIIINLTEPWLKKALDFELMIKNNDIDTTTGLPLYSQFYTLLDEKLNLAWKDNSTLSVIIFELYNFKDLSEKNNSKEILKVFTNSILSLFNDPTHDFIFSNYKNTNQISLISTNLDQDGISFYLVRLYKRFNNSNYYINDGSVNFQISVGYATQKSNKYSAESLLEEAENLLEISKL